MRKELQEKIYKKCPNLYRDRNKSMMKTCMCWGLDVEDGWYGLLEELSIKLEKIIVDYKKEHPDPDCLRCGCQKEDHYACKTRHPGRCLLVKKFPKYHFTCKYYNKKGKFIHWYYRNIKQKVVNIINRIVGKFNYKTYVCHCEEYDPICPRASQVKEKFATLRMYLDCGTDEMYNLIDEYEEISARTCEYCGQPGIQRIGGWIKTLCDECDKGRK